MFHDGSISSPIGVIGFYRGDEFNSSPGGMAVGGIQLTNDQVSALSEFLLSLSERPYRIAGGPIQFEDRVIGGGAGTLKELTVTTLERTFMIRCAVTGPNAAEFRIVSCPFAEEYVPAGETRTITVSFEPTTPGAKAATVEVHGLPASGVEVRGTALQP
jgi:hypothetical protein